jgi:predicted nucleotide-binding protein (sugar kinase/HSP70/actin superfamily)
MRVGIPRAMLYHHYGECWLEFMETLGVEVFVSDYTTSDILTRGTVHADNENCLPVKVFSGHMFELKDRVDLALVPRVVSEEYGTWACPKFLGLPDLARSLDPDLPDVLAPVMDLGDRRCLWVKDWYRTARALGASRLSAAAAVTGLLENLARHRLQSRAHVDTGDMKIGVAGHLYNVHDPRVSLGLLDRIRAMDATPLTVDHVLRSRARYHANTLSRKIFWSFESRLAGTVLNWSRSRSVAGILFVTSFACGPGSMVGALLEDQLGREGSVPLMTITLDEHAAEAGLVTRLEAFIDMLRYSGRADTRVGGAAVRAGGGPR